jgi:hypothetical protein
VGWPTGYLYHLKKKLVNGLVEMGLTACLTSREEDSRTQTEGIEKTPVEWSGEGERRSEETGEGNWNLGSSPLRRP